MDKEMIVMYNIKDIERIFCLSRTKAYQLVNSSGFPTLRLNNRILIPSDKLNTWINKQCGKTYKY